MIGGGAGGADERERGEAEMREGFRNIEKQIQRERETDRHTEAEKERRGGRVREKKPERIYDKYSAIHVLRDRERERNKEKEPGTNA